MIDVYFPLADTREKSNAGGVGCCETQPREAMLLCHPSHGSGSLTRRENLLRPRMLPRLLGAFPDHRRGTAARRGWDRIRQVVTGDGERALLFGAVPIGQQR